MFAVSSVNCHFFLRNMSQSIKSFREYLLVRQDAAFVTHFIKRESGEWVHQSYDEAAQAIKIESLDCEILLSEIYRNVEFAEAK